MKDEVKQHLLTLLRKEDGAYCTNCHNKYRDNLLEMSSTLRRALESRLKTTINGVAPNPSEESFADLNLSEPWKDCKVQYCIGYFTLTFGRSAMQNEWE